MSAGVQLHLALILFAPWFAVLSVLFWRYPRQPHGPARAAFDTASLLLATAAAAGGMYWGMAEADAGYGPMWKQVLATSVAYGLYLAVMTLALVVRTRWLRRRDEAIAGSAA
ncbi:hypothetical protein QLQ15_06800 [Lysobacter sp. LF1]|uniref:Uncharacterized protein n=1 Tax=Lysobacter stagni TaxID=3045172 RepID=A0ABT6XFD3_9GAMM|nr:hypothetical protein [Lysobacter sp. LF1]MDI9238623.1 hypothetical protein [Lysobacter sp. LF1]